jgi:tetratricopeptide (TPR) repeat protein
MHCGAEIMNNLAFCPLCGARAKKAAPSRKSQNTLQTAEGAEKAPLSMPGDPRQAKAESPPPQEGRAAAQALRPSPALDARKTQALSDAVAAAPQGGAPMRALADAQARAKAAAMRPSPEDRRAGPSAPAAQALSMPLGAPARARRGSQPAPQTGAKAKHISQGAVIKADAGMFGGQPEPIGRFDSQLDDSSETERLFLQRLEDSGAPLDRAIRAKQNSAQRKARGARQQLAPLFGAFALLIAATAFASGSFFVRSGRYEAAVARFSSGSYEEAQSAFAKLGRYRDSYNYLDYIAAMSLLSQDRLDDAQAAFERMGPFMDAPMRAQECKNEREYGKALKALAEGRPDEAFAAFEKLGAYKDSSLRALECLEQRPLSGPFDGQGGEAAGDGKLTIKLSGESDCYYLLSSEGGERKASGYIRSGESAEAAVPQGRYILKTAYGDGSQWFGQERMFGTNGYYSIYQSNGQDKLAIGTSALVSLKAQNGEGTDGDKPAAFQDF